MKIAFITSYPAIEILSSGQVRPKYRDSEHPVPWVRLLAEELSGMNDVELRIFAYGRAVTRHHIVNKGGISYEFIPKRIPARFEPYHFYLPARGDLMRSVAGYSPDIVVGFGTETGNAQAALTLPFPGVVFIQGILAKLDPYLGYNWLKSRIGMATEKAAIRKAAGVVAESRFAYDWASEVSPKTKLCIIPHPLDEAFLKIKPSYAEKNILCAGRMYNVKGTDFVLRSFALCEDKSCRLKMIGHGHEKYLKLARELGISERVDFTGRLSPDLVRDEMSRARVMVMGSRMDTSPNVITEAHAAGLPVIGTRAGGMPEMIDDAKDGFVVAVDDESAMAGKMAALVCDAELCRKQGMAGREKVRKLNNAASVAAAHVEFYRKILSSE